MKFYLLLILLKQKKILIKKISIIITEKKKNHLSSFAKKYKNKNYFSSKIYWRKIFYFFRDSISSMFLMGINILKLKKNILSFFTKKIILIKNLINLSKIYNSKKINSLILLNYSQGFEYFMLWCQQLIAESLGKKGKGIIPLFLKDLKIIIVSATLFRWTKR